MLLLALPPLVGCAAGPEGLRETPEGDGPLVVVDWDAEPLPEIPFPNDLATRPDPTSPTGLRVNISKEAPTQRERDARTKLDELSGFGIYAPITVSFEEMLNLDELIRRQPNDFELGESVFLDDAVFVIDVDPDSPDYLEPVALDLGHGRYVYEAEGTGQFFPNDPRAEQPSLVFETEEEDLDGDGVLDWGEDSDNDGVLDHPNVWPEGGDARADLLDFYELESNTLILRPVAPLREEGRYAVVLTNRLEGADGNPVRSPWAWVNHTRQTEALLPLEDALPELGLSVDDIAFTWVFSTGRVTGDLVDLRRGLDGEGPFGWLATDYPGGVDEALPMHELDDVPAQILPASTLTDALVDLGLFEGATADFVLAAYAQFGGNVVGGSFLTPYGLADRDDGGVSGGDSDEWWLIDATTGSFAVEPARIPFTCILPSPETGATQPYDVAYFGHGHGSSRYDVLLFGWALNRVGIAACAIDWPGHGPSVDPDQELLIEAMLGATGLYPFYEHLQDSRYRDLTNDGVPDSGADQWISEPFHTRDMVRQGVLDWMQLTKSLRACGQGEMDLVALDGSVSGSATTCDWDGDGTPDIGGPDASITVLGGSLGGINTAVAAAVMPDVDAFAPIVPGAGLLDVGIRSDLGGVIAAVVGRMLTPLVLGIPDGAGGIEIVQYVNAFGEMEQVHVASLSSFPAGGRVIVENLSTGESSEGMIPSDGSFRLSIAADALEGYEKRALLGIPDSGPEEGVVYSVEDNAGLGDYLRITIQAEDGAEVAVIDRYDTDVVYEGVTLPAGSPVVAASHGSGKIRSTPEIRRLAMVMAMALEPADPAAYGPHWFLEPFEDLGGEPANVLLAPTIGDQGVTISTGLSLARVSGLLDWQDVDPRYGMSRDRWLIEHEVYRAVEAYGPYTTPDGAACLYDPDDLDEGTDGTGAPTESPMRATRHTHAGVSALRLPYPQITGKHGFNEPDPSNEFDVALFVTTQVATYFQSRGTELRDDVCMGSESCADIPRVEWETE